MAMSFSLDSYLRWHSMSPRSPKSKGLRPPMVPDHGQGQAEDLVIERERIKGLRRYSP